MVDLWSMRLRHVREKATRYQRQFEFPPATYTPQFGFQEWTTSEESESDMDSVVGTDTETKTKRGELSVSLPQPPAAPSEYHRMAFLCMLQLHLQI